MVLPRRVFAPALALLGACHTPAAAPVARPAPRPGVDPRVASAVAAISRESFARDVAGLVSAREPGTSARDPHARERGFIQAELRAAGYTPVLLPVPGDGTPEYNIVAERAGADPSRVVLAVAHYDAVEYSPGADDNASGVAGALAVARAARALSDTRATVRVVFFALEEHELRGSRQYVNDLSSDERARIVGVFDLEMIGYRDARPGAQRYPAGLPQLLPMRALPDTGDFLGVIGLVSTPEPMRALSRARVYAPGLPTVMVPMAPAMVLVLTDLLRSDHAPFWAAGIPAVMVTDTSEFRNPNYHSYRDGESTLDPAFGALGARWITAAVLTLAEPGPATGASAP